MIRLDLLSGRRIAQNVAWNFFGVGLPAVLALVTIPILIDTMGAAKFGVLTLAWATVGYFSLFDMGLGRAMTQLIARQLGSDDQALVPSLFWTGTVLMAILGLVGGASLALIAPWLVESALKVPPELQQQTLQGVLLVALGLPLVVSSSGLQGVVEAHQKFRMVFVVKLIQGTITFAGPLLATFFTDDLSVAIGTLLAGRLLSWGLLLSACLRTIAGLRSGRFEKALVRPMVTFGGWMTVSNVLGPLLIYSDRMLIGVMLSMSAVAYYVTPIEVVTKLLILPNALLGVVFPLFAALLNSNPGRAVRLFERAVRYMFMAMAPVSLIGIGFAAPLMDLWIGGEFAQESHRIMQWLFAGILFNSVAHFPVSLLMASGRPDAVAKLHLLEAPVYLVMLWILLGHFGVEGAAIAWALRATVDALLMTLICGRIVPALRPRIPAMIMIGGATVLLLTMLILVPATVRAHIWASLALVLAFVPVAWALILHDDERQLVLSHAGLGTSH